MYSINNYTEKECFKILGLDVDVDPTDDELEKSIKTQKNKYVQISNERGKNLLTFFNDMYNRFFEPEEQHQSDDEESDDEESDDEQINNEIRPYRNQVFDQRNDVFYANNVYEGFNTSQQEGYSDPTTDEYKVARTDEYGDTDDEHTYKYDFEVKGDELLLLTSETSNNSYNNNNDNNFNYTVSGGTGEGETQKIVFAESINAYDSNSDNYENFSITKNIEHTPGQLNPLLKETIKRTIYINSQDRDQVFDDNNALTTDFHFYLEETLRNVVSLKLYAVQIPYTWYTIDSGYGSNFFYLKSDTPGITNKDTHEYKIEIPPGNYTPENLVQTINSQMVDTLRTDHTDVSFGNTSISYNTSSVRPTIIVDIEKVYDASDFEITMSDYTEDDSSFNSIAKFLGFTQKNENIVHTLETTSNKSDVILTTPTNISFSIVRYTPIILSSQIQEIQDIHEEVLCSIIVAYNVSMETIIANINSELSNSERIDGTVDVSYNDNDNDNDNDISYNWTWNIVYNRYSIPMKQNQKLAINATDISSRLFFGFHSSYTELNPYVLYGNDNVQQPLKTDVSGVQIILRNNWIRDVMYVSDLSFESTVDFSINIDNSNEMYIEQLIGHVNTNFTEKIKEIAELEFSTCGLSVASIENGNNNKNNEIINIFDIDISLNHTIDGSSTIFEKDPSSGGIVVDFSGFLYDRLFFRTKETTYDICGLIHTEISNNVQIFTPLKTELSRETSTIRTTVSMNVLEDRTSYIYTSIHPFITSFNDITDNGFNKNVLRIKGNPGTNYSDFSFNLDFSDFSYSSMFKNYSFDLSHVVLNNNEKLYGILNIKYVKIQYPGGTIGKNGFPLSIDDISFNKNMNDVTYQIDSNDAMQLSTLTISFFKSFKVTDYKIELRDNENDPDFTTGNDFNIWKNALFFSDLSTNFIDKDIRKEGRISSGNISLNQFFVGKDQTITIKPKSGSAIEGVIPIVLNMNNIQNEPTDTIINYINTELSNNVITHGSYFRIVSNKYLTIKMHINQVFTSLDYKLVFFDDTYFIKCNASIKHARNAKYDTTLGYILGYRNYLEYQLNPLFVYDSNTITRQNNEITITSDAVLSVYIYNTLMIVIEDFNQNHINDKVVSVSQRDTKINMQNRKLYKCNPYTSVIQSRNKSLTQKQLYSMDAITRAQTETQVQKSRTQSHRDIFAVIPIKSGLSPGETFVEFGGTLQSQERTYFGPVNISRLRVKLMTDKGDIINLNGTHWSFQLICETLYKT